MDCGPWVCVRKAGEQCESLFGGGDRGAIMAVGVVCEVDEGVLGG